MRAFSQLLDDLVYTRSRLSKLRLIGDYLKSTPDPDRGLALAALTGTLDIPAVKPAVVRALAEERIDPVLLRMSRDYVGDMAETVSLLWPVPEGEPVDLDDGTIRLSEAVERLQGGVEERCAGGAGRRCSTISMSRGAMRSSSLPPARFGSGFRRGWPSRRWPMPSGSMSRRSRRCGTG